EVGVANLADLDARHHDGVPRADPGRVGEERARLEVAGEDAALEEQGAGGEHQDDGEGDAPDDVRVALAEGLGREARHAPGPHGEEFGGTAGRPSVSLES